MDAMGLAAYLGDLDCLDISIELALIEGLLQQTESTITALSVAQYTSFNLQPLIGNLSEELGLPAPFNSGLHLRAQQSSRTLAQEFVEDMLNYLGDINLCFDYAVESYECDGVPILDSNGGFIEFELMVFDDFITNARIDRCVEVLIDGEGV